MSSRADAKAFNTEFKFLRNNDVTIPTAALFIMIAITVTSWMAAQMASELRIACAVDDADVCGRLANSKFQKIESTYMKTF